MRALSARRPMLSPLQPLLDRPAHHPVLVQLGHEIKRFGEVLDALLVGRLGERVGHVR